MRPYSVLAAIAGYTLAQTPTPARAHGQPAAILQVVAADDQGPRAVRLTEGLAIDLAGTWTYVCPDVFGLDIVSLALSADGHTVWVPAAESLLRLRTDGTIEPQNERHLAWDSVLGLSATRDDVFALRFAPDGTEVYRLDPSGSERVFTDPDRWSSFAVDEPMLHLARAEDGNLTVLSHELGGASETTTYPLDVAGAVPRLRAVGGKLFVEIARPAARELFRLDGRQSADAGVEAPTRLLAEAEPIFGPVQTANGTIWASADPQLFRFDREGIPETVASPVDITCVDSLAESAFACARTELYALGNDAVGARLVTLTSLVAPSETHPDLLGSMRCQDEWVLFRNDLVNSGVIESLDELDSGIRTTLDASAPEPPHVKSRATSTGGGCGHERLNDVSKVGPLLLCMMTILLSARRWAFAKTRRIG